MARPATCFYWKARSCFATDVGGKRTVLVKGSKTKANRELALQELVKLLGQGPQLAVSDNVTVADLVDSFFIDCAARVDAGELKPKTVDCYYRPYGRLVKKECGNWRAGHITKSTVQSYRQRLNERGLSPTTVKNRLATLRAVLRWAKDAHLIRSVPPISTGEGRRRQHIPTQDEIKQLMAVARPDVADVLTVLLNCPVRPGDCFGLTKRSVDLTAGVLRLVDSKTGQRLVPIADIPAVVEVLRRRLNDPCNTTELVFCTVRGRPWDFRYFGECVRIARGKAGLGKHVVAYSLRHAWTTNAFLNGVPLHTVRALRADRDVKTTLIYEHLAEHLNVLQQAARQAVGLPVGGGK